MDVIVIFNGLGNQMSQYALYLAKKSKGYKCVAIFDPKSKDRHNGSELDRIFPIYYEDSLRIKAIKIIYFLLTNRFFRPLLYLIGVRLICEPKNYDFNDKYTEPGKGWLNFYFGGWHSEKYFYDIEDIILKQFTFKDNITEENFQRYKRLIENNVSKCVSIHIRRGDYLDTKPGDFYQYGGVATKQYYLKSIDYFKSMLINPIFLVFSNDIEWCKKEFGIDNFHYVDCNVRLNSWHDMYLMSLCKYHINANSSFSWWGAWLCQHKEQVTLCPESFLSNVVTKDFYPDSWVKLSSE